MAFSVGIGFRNTEISDARITQILGSRSLEQATTMSVWDRITDAFCGGSKKAAIALLYKLVVAQRSYSKTSDEATKSQARYDACEAYVALKNLATDGCKQECFPNQLTPDDFGSDTFGSDTPLTLIIHKPPRNDYSMVKAHEFEFRTVAPDAGEASQFPVQFRREYTAKEPKPSRKLDVNRNNSERTVVVEATEVPLLPHREMLLPSGKPDEHEDSAVNPFALMQEETVIYLQRENAARTDARMRDELRRTGKLQLDEEQSRLLAQLTYCEL